MRDELIEIVARAIYKVDGSKGWHLHSKFYLDSATAALAAIEAAGCAVVRPIIFPKRGR